MKRILGIVFAVLLAASSYAQLSIGPGGQVTIAVGNVTGLADGNVIIGTASTPDVSVGQNGDYYVVLSTACTWGPKASKVWPGSCSAWPGSSGSVDSWGSITGTLSAQTDLQAALDGKQAALGFTPENVANKSTATSLGTSDTAYPSQNAVKVYADAAVSVETTRATAAESTNATAISTETSRATTAEAGKQASGTYAGTGSCTLPNVVRVTTTGGVTCAQPSDVTGNAATATAFSGTPTKCSAGNYPLGVDAQGNAQSCTPASTAQTHTIIIPVSGGTSPIATGQANIGPPSPPSNYACTINSAKITSPVSGSITVDVWKAASAIPTSANKISASAPVTLSSAAVNTASSLTGWTTSVSANDIFWATVATADGVLTTATIQLGCQ